MKFKNLLLYLRENSFESFIEVCIRYNETLSVLFLNHFKAYSGSMKKMIKEDSTKNDLVCSEHMDPRAFYVPGFDLNNREHLIERLETIIPIISHVATKENKHFYLEEVFHSLVMVLSDTCSFNFFFTIDFFCIRPDQYQAVFGELFTRTFQMLIETLASILNSTHDILGLLLVLQLNSYFQSKIEKSGLFIMNEFFEKVRIVIWPRLQSLLDANLKEIDNSKYLQTHDVTVHTATKRFTQFIYSLHKVSPNDDMFRQRFSLFKKAFLNMIERMALSINDKKNRIAFEINNLDYFLEVFQEGKVSLIGEFAQLEGDFHNYIEKFIEFQLNEVFGEIVMFTIEGNDQKRIEILLHDFNSNWKRRLEIIETIEKDLFINEASQIDILKRTNTKLLMSYSDFVDKVKKMFPQLSKIIVSVHSLMAEIQR